MSMYYNPVDMQMAAPPCGPAQAYCAPAPSCCSLAAACPRKPCCNPAPLHRSACQNSAYFTLAVAYGN